MTEADGRHEIFQVAHSQLNAHYLPGARGGVPGYGPALDRSVNLLKDPKWASLSICGASNSLGYCYGRWAALGSKGYLFQPNTSRLNRLKDWVNAYQDYPVEGWPPFDGYGTTPRRLGSKPGSTIAMGEDCRGRRHFDCIGFIFWVLNEVVPHEDWVKNVIPQYEAGFDTIQSLGKIKKSQLKNGDIVTRTSTSPKHIGIANEEGWVVHASREGDGIKYEPFEKGNWTNVSRVVSWLF
jgi:hypothetical protein